MQPWQQWLVSLPHIPYLKRQNRDPGQLYKGRPSGAVPAQKASTFDSLAKGGKRSGRTAKKVAKSVTAQEREGK